MLVIRQEQMAVLAKASFALWLENHARRFFPAQCKELGPEKLRAYIEARVERGRSYGFSQGPDLCSFLDLAFTFGEDFDTAQRWAHALLTQAGGKADAITMEKLYHAAMAVLEPESLETGNLSLARDDGKNEGDAST